MRPLGTIRLRTARSGFTLVEMLVAVTLVLLMMVMFGEMFQLASGSVSKQRVMADNDQNARTFVTVMRADLDKRTFRIVTPFFPGELASNVTGTALSFQKRQGYFYVSCNNPADGTDDVLQFTVNVENDENDLRNSDESPYFGRAIPLYAGAGSSPAINFLSNPNQPDRDDGQITANFAAASKAAEVSYFLRGKRLYRRVLLIRDPLPTREAVDASNPAQPTFRNPTNNTNVDYFLPGGVYDTQATGSFGSIGFWRDFDFSAHRVATSLPAPKQAQFNGLDALANDQTTGPFAGSGHPYFPALGQSWNRFGHNHEIEPGSLNNGLPREFTTANPSTAEFIGRFTHEETSHARFRYPQATSQVPPTPPGAPGAWNGNPMDAAGTELTLDPDSAAVNEFQPNGPFSRPGVDLLLANVHEFRVELWDARINAFVSPGHSRTTPGGVPGDYNLARRLNATYGPLPFAASGTAKVFDTWHPQFDRNFNTAVGVPLGDIPDRPPYRPLEYDRTGVSGIIPPNLSGAAPTWRPNTQYQPGDIVFPRGEDLNGNGFLDPGEDGSNGFPADGALQEDVILYPGAPRGMITEDLNGNGVLDSGEDGAFGFPANGVLDPQQVLLREPMYPTGLTFAYRCVGRADGQSVPPASPPRSGAFDPVFPNSAGRRFTDNEVVWESIYNVRPLRAIRITVRFEHPTSKQMKQITLVHSLRDTTLP